LVFEGVHLKRVVGHELGRGEIGSIFTVGSGAGRIKGMILGYTTRRLRGLVLAVNFAEIDHYIRSNAKSVFDGFMLLLVGVARDRRCARIANFNWVSHVAVDQTEPKQGITRCHFSG
tara:strand:+ start:121 stop:471 length:351 start_codon:yes stop_codon:yes gene_type:complete